MKSLGDVLHFAYTYHDEQYRKDGKTPYIVHPIEVMRLLQRFGETNEHVLKVALCHDLIEDTKGGDRQRVRLKLHELGLLDDVEALTFYPELGGSKADYMASFANKPRNVVVVKAADRICNVKDFIASCDYNYAVKYLNKGTPIFVGLRQFEDDVAKALLEEAMDITNG